MTDIASISSILGCVKTATEIAKLLKDSDLSLEKAEMKLKLADLISALADARIETAEIQSLIAAKDERIAELLAAIETKHNIKYEKPYYWLGEGQERDGPFCQRCFDNGGKLIRLQDYENGYWDCKVCKNTYTDSRYVAPLPMGGGSSTDWYNF